MYTLRPRRAIIDDEAGGGAWLMESMDGCFVNGVVCCIIRHGCGAAVRSASVKFVAFCGLLWPFVAFWRFGKFREIEVFLL
jgi:hypothetical protein